MPTSHSVAIYSATTKPGSPTTYSTHCPPTQTQLTQDTTTMPLPQLPLLSDSSSKITTHQLTLSRDNANQEWGDCDQYYKPHDFFRIISKNVSTLNLQSLDMMAIADELHQANASIFAAQETNTPWKPANLLSIKTQCHRVQRHHKMAVSSSQDGNEATYQPGGTLTLALGKWASCVIGHGCDELLGRWSYLEMVGQGRMRLMVVSAYHPCPQQFDATTNTVTAQQTQLLLQQGVKNPNPRLQFTKDLIKQI